MFTANLSCPGQSSLNRRSIPIVTMHDRHALHASRRVTVGNWLEYRDTVSYKACDGIWAKFMTEKANKSGLVGKVATHR